MKSGLLFNEFFMNSLDTISNVKGLSIKKCVEIAKVIIKISEEQKVLFNLKDKLLKDYNVTGFESNGTPIFADKDVTDETKKEFNEKVTELLSQEIEIKKIKIKDNVNLNLTPTVISYLMHIIDFEEDEDISKE